MNVLRNCILFTLAAALIMGVYIASVPVASAQEPSYGTAVVDGNIGEFEWSESDPFAFMYRDGVSSSGTIESDLSLRYDCNTGKMYVLVLTSPGVEVVDEPQHTWIAINDESKKVTFAEFAWVYVPYGIGEFQWLVPVGYEASFFLPLGTYKFWAHIQVLDNGLSFSSATDEDGIDLAIICDVLDAAGTVVGAINAINSGHGTFKNRNMQNALTNKLLAVVEQIDRGEYQEALDKLEHDLLPKTNGCAEIGSPDKNDWITDCTTQAEVHAIITEAIATLEILM